MIIQLKTLRPEQVAAVVEALHYQLEDLQREIGYTDRSEDQEYKEDLISQAMTIEEVIESLK